MKKVPEKELQTSLKATKAFVYTDNILLFLNVEIKSATASHVNVLFRGNGQPQVILERSVPYQ